MRIDILKSFRYKFLLKVILLINRIAFNLFVSSIYIDKSRLNLEGREDIHLKAEIFRNPKGCNTRRYIKWHSYLHDSGWSSTSSKVQLARLLSLQKSISENGFLTDKDNSITATWVLIAVYITPEQKISLGFNCYLLREGAHRLAYTESKNIPYRNIRLMKPSELAYPRFVGLSNYV